MIPSLLPFLLGGSGSSGAGGVQTIRALGVDVVSPGVSIELDQARSEISIEHSAGADVTITRAEYDVELAAVQEVTL